MMYFGNVGTGVEEFPSRVANKSRKRNLNRNPYSMHGPSQCTVILLYPQQT
jgi:hypothetical protein